MNRKWNMALSLAVILSLVITTLAIADNVQNNVVSDPPSITLKAGDPTSIVNVGFYIQPQGQGTDGDPQCNFDSDSEKLTFTINTPLGVIADPSNLTFNKCHDGSNFNSLLVKFSAGPSAVSGQIGFTQTQNTSGGSFNYDNAVFYINVEQVTPPNTPPSVSVLGVTKDASYEFGSVPAAGCSVTDAEDGDSTFAATLSAITGPLSAYGLGSQTASCSYTDAGGLTDTDSAEYSIVDTIAPELTLPDDMTEEAAGPLGAVVIFESTANDLVDPAPGVSCTPASGSTFALGDTVVICIATDAAGNEGSDSFVITVEDTTPPVVTVPDDFSVEATGPSGTTVTFEASALDIVDGALTPICVPTSGSTFPLGTTAVTCSATDDAGNSSSENFNVTVQDKTPPTVLVPSDITAEATGPSGAVVTFSSSASDLVDGALTPTCLPASGSTFALGTATVSCSATDAHGNTGSASFIVTVVDTTPPEVIVPADSSVEASGPDGAAVTFFASASDLVDGEITPTCAPASGATFPLGKTTVKCSAIDAHGNTGSASFKITVVDTTPPEITVPLDITAEATGPSGAVVTFSASATDIVDGAIIPTCVPASSSTFALGETIVTCSATDAHGNTDSASFKITVVDTTPPVLTLPENMIVDATGVSGAIVTYTATATDLVDGVVPVICIPPSGSPFLPGLTTVNCTATDTHGNIAAGSFTVKVKFNLFGFYSPVDMNGVYNMVKGGSTVPLKFEVFAGPTELTNISVVSSFVTTKVSCSTSAPTDDIEFTTTGGTTLRYDTTGGQFIQNWQTPKTAGVCYRVTMTTQDLSTLIAYFKLK